MNVEQEKDKCKGYINDLTKVIKEAKALRRIEKRKLRRLRLCQK